MTKRKLRNCSQCGVRHGPPFGKFCNRMEEAFAKLNEEMSAAGAAGGEDAIRVLGGDVLESVPEMARNEEFTNREESNCESELAKHDLQFEKFGQSMSPVQSPWRQNTEFGARQEPAAFKLPVAGERSRSSQNKPTRRPKQPSPFIEREEVIERLDRQENVVGKVCEVYQATMERFAQFANPPQPKAEPKPAQQEKKEEKQAEAAATPETVKMINKPSLQVGAEIEKIKKFGWDSFDLESANGDAWTESHGR